MYCLARTIDDGVGPSAGRITVAALFSLVMLIPFAWAITIPDLPDIYARQFRGRRWWAAGRCASCGYRFDDRATRDRCAECGEALVEPEPYAYSGRTVRRFAVMLLFAWIIGMGVGEAWVASDEAAFAREVLVTPGMDRSRRWPNADRVLREP
jgi:hypothetical protein